MMTGWAKHLAGKVRTVIFDEAQELRHADTVKYRAAGHIADRAYFCMELTATPVYNYGGEAFNLIDIIAKDALGTKPEFTREWGAEMSNGRVMVGEPRELGSYLREQRLLLCRTDEELGIDRAKPLRIPQVVDIDEEVMTEESAGLEELARLIVSSTATKEERWRTSGELDWKLRRATGLAKAPFVATFVKLLLQSEDKVLLFGWHRDVYDVWMRVFEKADIGYVLYTGSETASAKEKAKATFLTDPNCRVMMMSLRSGAGLDGLEQACRVAVFGELDWSPSMHEQCIGRLNRNNQPHQVLAYFLTAETGSDPAIMEVLGIKRGQAEPIRNPDVELFEAVHDTGDRVKKLVAAVLEAAPPAPRLRLVR
jgi:SNF2 family DNA or RNA helicase